MHPHIYLDQGGNGVRRPVGTAFGIAMPLEQAPGRWVQYLVTARHIVNGARAAGGGLKVRFNTRDGGHVDMPEPPDEWFCHPATDVAITGAAFGDHEVDFTSFPVDDFLATDAYIRENDIGEGDDVFSASLFSPTAAKRNEPVMRFGKISSARRHPVEIRSDPGPEAATISVDAYLIETASWGGSSGAPVFLSFDPLRRLPAPIAAMTPLLGLIQGHFDIPAQVRPTAEGDAQGVVGLNSGMAIVIPASAILKLLMDDEQIEWRRRIAV
jgi:hypothetical protein